jgi:hypothetical protein
MWPQDEPDPDRWGERPEEDDHARLPDEHPRRGFERRDEEEPIAAE